MPWYGEVAFVHELHLLTLGLEIALGDGVRGPAFEPYLPSRSVINQPEGLASREESAVLERH